LVPAISTARFGSTGRIEHALASVNVRFKNFIFELKKFRKKYLHVRNGNSCGFAKFETEIHLFVACKNKTKKTKIRTPRSKLHIRNLKQ
jgi:hypothetical protein